MIPWSGEERRWHPARRHVPAGLLPLLVCALVAAGDAGAQSAVHVSGGREAFERADFRTARTIFEAVIVSPQSSRAEIAEGHAYLAALDVAMGNEAAAQQHVRIALALSPPIESPPAAPPSLARMFAAERETAGSRGLGVAIEPSEPLAPGDGRSLEVRATAVPEGLALRVRTVCRTRRVVGSNTAEITAGAPVATVRLARLEPGADLSCVADLTTTSGARLDQVRWRQVLPAAPRVARSTSSDWVLPTVVAGSALVAVGAVVLVLVLVPSGAELGEPRIGP